MSISNKLIVILGPTSSGKSEMALRLARRLEKEKNKEELGINGAEIVSADSRQIYKGMDIGTAKLIPDQLLDLKFQAPLLKIKDKEIKPLMVKGIPHYLIDIVNPDEEFSLAQYKKLAIEIIKNIQSRGKIPLLVGGTGLYITSVVENLEIPKVAPNPTLRKVLEDMTLEDLLAKLEKLDPDTYQSIDRKNRRRIVRALEVIVSSGKEFSKQKYKGEPLFDALQIGIEVPREDLYKKIDARVDKMIAKGLESEARNLLDKGFNRNLPSMSGIGYKQMTMYLNDEVKFNEAVRLIKRDTHRYARRQMTWFRRYKNILWVKNCNEAEPLIRDFLKKN